MQVTQHNDIKVYNLSAGKSLPQFLEEAQKKSKSLRHNDEFKNRLDLIQDFEFRIASTRVKISPNGEYIAATGIYPPQVKIFESRELGLKCARGLDSEVVDFLWLSEDWKKLAFLMDDRTVEFHSQFGRHHRIRVPKHGRTLAYDSESCNIFVAGSAAEVFRIDLEGGIFQTPLPLRRIEEVNALAVNPAMPVLSCAGNQGLVESYDLRESGKILRSLEVCMPDDDTQNGIHVTACTYSPNGMLLAAGTAGGVVRVYDVRSSRPLVKRDHMNGYPIKSVCFHDHSDLLVASADKKSIKVWNASSGAIAASVESKAPIHQLEFVPSTGLFFVANEQPRIGAFFVPSLGLAPKWCSFLDAITEELEESKQQQVFDDFKFVTQDDLDQLGANDLVGTKFLQPYMHGYFMDHRLHTKLKAATEPFAFEEYRKAKIKQKLDKLRTMRTRVKTKVSVNPQLHQKLLLAAEEGKEKDASKKRRAAASKAEQMLGDDRFKDVFEDPDFAIQEKGSADVGTPSVPTVMKTKKAKKA